MANPHRGEIVITLAGQSFDLRLDNESICEIEAGLQLAVNEWKTKGGMRLFREALYVGVDWRSRKRMSRKQISAMIMQSDLEHITTQVAAAIELAMPSAESEDDDQSPLEVVKAEGAAG